MTKTVTVKPCCPDPRGSADWESPFEVELMADSWPRLCASLHQLQSSVKGNAYELVSITSLPSEVHGLVRVSVEVATPDRCPTWREKCRKCGIIKSRDRQDIMDPCWSCVIWEELDYMINKAEDDDLGPMAIVGLMIESRDRLFPR